MKRFLLLAIIALLLAACGGNAEPTAAPAGNDATPTAAPAATSTTEPAAPAGDDNQEAPAAATEAPAPVGDSNPGGLPVNPDPILKGEPFIVEGTIVNASLIPVDKPQFLIEAPNGLKYRVDTQPVDQIFVEDGTQLKAFEIRPGLLVRATVFLPADATAADVLSTTDLVILLSE